MHCKLPRLLFVSEILRQFIGAALTVKFTVLQFSWFHPSAISRIKFRFMTWEQKQCIPIYIC